MLASARSIHLSHRPTNARDAEHVSEKFWNQRINLPSVALTALPGTLIFVAVYIFALRHGAHFDTGIFSLGQAIGPAELHHDFVASILNLHVQPPGWNALLWITTANDSWGFKVLAATYAGLAILTIYLIAWTLNTLEVNSWLAMAVAAIYGALPSTVLLSLWPYTTTLVGLFMMVAFSGLAVSFRKPVFGTALSVGGGSASSCFDPRSLGFSHYSGLPPWEFIPCEILSPSCENGSCWQPRRASCSFW
jgi:hypothetical protein